jgi:hypothetical protein
MRIWCMNCGKSVSTEVPEGTIIRAWVECPECIEADPALGKLKELQEQLKLREQNSATQASQP